MSVFSALSLLHEYTDHVPKLVKEEKVFLDSMSEKST